MCMYIREGCIIIIKGWEILGVGVFVYWYVFVGDRKLMKEREEFLFMFWFLIRMNGLIMMVLILKICVYINIIIISINDIDSFVIEFIIGRVLCYFIYIMFILYL